VSVLICGVVVVCAHVMKVDVDERSSLLYGSNHEARRRMYSGVEKIIRTLCQCRIHGCREATTAENSCV
jgi:hypothetical protein